MAIGNPILPRDEVVYCIVKVFFLVMEPWPTRSVEEFLKFEESGG